VIKVFKMISGEELISEVSSIGGGYALKNPATIMIQQGVKGMSVGLAPYMVYAKGDVNLYLSAIASEAEADDELANQYNRIFGSGIEVVPANALSGLQIVS
jgi:hypothetical protein